MKLTERISWLLLALFLFSIGYRYGFSRAPQTTFPTPNVTVFSAPLRMQCSKEECSTYIVYFPATTLEPGGGWITVNGKSCPDGKMCDAVTGEVTQ